VLVIYLLINYDGSSLIVIGRDPMKKETKQNGKPFVDICGGERGLLY